MHYCTFFKVVLQRFFNFSTDAVVAIKQWYYVFRSNCYACKVWGRDAQTMF